MNIRPIKTPEDHKTALARTTISVEGSYCIKRNGDTGYEPVLWTVTIEQNGDGWTYSAHADVAGQEWEDEDGPWDTEADAIDEAERRLSGNNGMTYDPAGSTVSQS